MAIEFNKPSNASSTTIGTRRSASTPPGKGVSQDSGTAAKVGTGNDQVAISSHAQRIQSLEARIQQMPEVDMARVEAIKSAIANGSFEVDAESTAKKMFSLEQSIHRLYDKE